MDVIRLDVIQYTDQGRFAFEGNRRSMSVEPRTPKVETPK